MMTHMHCHANSAACSRNAANMAASCAAISAARFIFALRFYFCGFIGVQTDI